MYVAEHSEHNIEIAEQDFNEHDVEMVKDLIIEQRDYLVNQTELQNQLDKLINVMENNPNVFPKCLKEEYTNFTVLTT